MKPRHPHAVAAIVAVALLCGARSALAAQGASPSPAATVASPAPAPSEDPAVTKLAENVIGEIERGAPDRKLFDDRMNAVLTPDLVARLAAQLSPLGVPKSVSFVGEAPEGSHRTYRYRVAWAGAMADEMLSLDGAGKITGLLISPAGNAPQPAPSVGVPGPLLSPGA